MHVSKNVTKCCTVLVERNLACCHVANAFLTRMDRAILAHMQAEKVHFFQKALGVDGLIVRTENSET